MQLNQRHDAKFTKYCINCGYGILRNVYSETATFIITLVTDLLFSLKSFLSFQSSMKLHGVVPSGVINYLLVVKGDSLLKTSLSTQSKHILISSVQSFQSLPDASTAKIIILSILTHSFALFSCCSSAVSISFTCSRNLYSRMDAVSIMEKLSSKSGYVKFDCFQVCKLHFFTTGD